MFTEIRHFDATGAGVQPSYLTADDYIEITGTPGADLGGVTLVVYSGTNTTPDVNYTFPTNTVLSPNGTALITHGQGAGASQPANFMYDGRGSFTGLFGSGTDAGYILKRGTDIIDAVTYDAFTFPAGSGVTASDWSGQVTGSEWNRRNPPDRPR
ncbi:MAG: lamin tail domain-containing protein [Owenweeksia sp.]|nr:lamin tail domain-containing protein [Owenweeksia sp.]